MGHREESETAIGCVLQGLAGRFGATPTRAIVPDCDIRWAVLLYGNAM